MEKAKESLQKAQAKQRKARKRAVEIISRLANLERSALYNCHAVAKGAAAFLRFDDLCCIIFVQSRFTSGGKP